MVKDASEVDNILDPQFVRGQKDYMELDSLDLDSDEARAREELERLIFH